MPLDIDRCQRLKMVLERLAEAGFSQQRVATRANLPTSYLSDIKLGRRAMSELFARRVGEEFGIDFQWLLSGAGSMLAPRLDQYASPTNTDLLLPVVDAPLRGEPRQSKEWDGSLLQIAGAGKTAAIKALCPYVLRIKADGMGGRLRRGDLVLISQEVDEHATVAIISHQNRLVLAYKGSTKHWMSLSDKKLTTINPEVVGSCIAILWAPL